MIMDEHDVGHSRQTGIGIDKDRSHVRNAAVLLPAQAARDYPIVLTFATHKKLIRT